MPAILVVDDDSGICQLCAIALTSVGYSVRTARNGVEATRMLEASTADLVVCDIYMPEKDGIETIADIRRRWPEAKVLAISGGAPPLPNMLETARYVGAVRSLAKPFEASDLVEAVRAALDDGAG